MKRLFSFLTTWAVVNPIQAALATLLLLGAGGTGTVIAFLTTPSITPQPSAAFTQSNTIIHQANNDLKVNAAGSAGAEFFPSTPTNSFFLTVEGSIDPALGTGASWEYALGNGSANGGLVLNGVGLGAPVFTTQKNIANTGNWWQSISPIILGTSPSVSSTQTGYLEGYFPWTASGGGCTREPSGIIGPTNAGTIGAAISDFGFQCSTQPTTPTLASIPLDGARQNATITGCTSNTPSGEAQVTVTVPLAHGIVPAGSATIGSSNLTLAGFSSPATAFNQTNYVATVGTAGTTLVLESPLGAAGSCPGGVTYPVTGGTALSGTGTGSVSMSALSTSNPFGTNETTGITSQPGGKFCAVIGEYGDDSPTPGFQFAAFSDWNGTALQHSPALSTWPNQGAANFTGYTIVNTQSPSSPALTVTAMNSYAITSASFSTTTGYATFTTSTSPNMVPGSEFTVSGATTTGGGTFNNTYIAVAGTSGTTLVGNPLSGPLGAPQATSLTAISTASTGSLVSVIVPGMEVFGTTGLNTFILPYGTFGGTGAGGTGTYALSANQIATGTFTASISGTTMTVTGTPTIQLAIGEGFSGAGVTGSPVITAYGTGTGGSGTYTISVSQGTIGSETMTDTGTLGSSGSPVTLFAWPPFYYSAKATASSSTTVGVLTARTQSAIGDYFSYIGGYNSALPLQFSGWGGALANVGDFYGIFPTSGNTPDQTALNSLCQKTTDYQAFASLNGLTVHSLYRLNDTGIWADSSVAQFTGLISGTALTIASTQSGSTSAMAAGTVIAGAGITGCPATCPTISSGSGSSYVLNTSGGTVSSEAMTAGNYKPATPSASYGVNGYVDSAGLHVTSIAAANKVQFTATTAYPVNSFVGHIDNGVTTGTTGNVLTVTTAPTGTGLTNTVTPGTQVCWSGGPSPCPYIVSNGSGGGGTGTYILNQNVSGGVPALTSFTGTVVSVAGNAGNLTPTNLVVSAISSGTVTLGMLVTDNSAHITGQPLYVVSQQSGTTGSTGTYTIVPNYYGPISVGETMYGVNAEIVPGQYLRDDATHTVTTPIKILGYGTGSNAPGVCATGEWGCGVYPIYNPAGLTIGSSGLPVSFTVNGATDGGSIAPGPALSIKDPGPGIIFPVTNYGSGTGTLFLSGTYNTGSLGGTPSAIQAQVSLTSGGPPVSGCSACAWTSLSNSSISGGAWSGRALNIPAGGPYFVSVRAANGTAYATMQTPIKVGLAFDFTSVGFGQTIIGGSQGGWAYSTYPGQWGFNTPSGGTFYLYDLGASVSGPDTFPGYVQMTNGDQLAISGSSGETLAEGTRDLEANLQVAMGYPVTVSDWTRDGVGNGIFTWSGTTQNQTVGLGDGSSTTWCSASTFCSNVSGGGTLSWDLAGLTGSQITASISGTTLTVTAVNTGGLQSGAVLSDSFTGGGNHITGSPTLVNCVSGCAGANFVPGGSTSTWTISANEGTVTSELMRADPSGGAQAPFYNPQAGGIPLVSQKGKQAIKAGTFSISVNGTVVCTDSSVYPTYNLMAGNCTGAGISSSFVNYVTGDYQVTFSTPPANGAVITASWVEIISPSDPGLTNVINDYDYTGTGSSTSGMLSAVISRTPGGTSGHIFGSCITDDTAALWETGYPTGSVGYAQMLDWFYGVRLPAIFNGTGSTPYMSPTTPLISANHWGGDGLGDYMQTTSQLSFNSLCDQWAVDLTVNSTFSATISSVSGTGPSTATLTLSGAATGPMWEGEVVGCPTFSLTCPVTAGTYITKLLTGTWGGSGSTYSLANQSTIPIAAIGSATAMANSVYYTAGPSIYAGGMNGQAVVPSTSGINGTDGYSPHPSFGMAGASRIARKWSAEIYGGLTGNAAPPTLDRVKADASGCDTSAIAGPCFDVGNTFAASHSATLASASATITVTGGISAHDRPFVVGQALSCAGCTAGRYITSIDVPPTQSTVTGAGEVGQTFHITANGTMGFTGTETVTAGCSGTAGTGSNCIDIAFSVNTTGTYGTAAALATCGENNLNQNTPPFTVPVGTCSTNGVGSLVHNFRIGAQQIMWGGTTPSQQGSSGSPYDDGVDPWSGTINAGGVFNQSGAFTCNIVAAKVVQCVKGVAYSSGLPTGVGQWSSGSTYIEYGDSVVGTGRGQTLVGNVGGQPFGFTAGSGYTAGTYTIPASNCVTSTGSDILPQIDVTVGSGGGIIDVYGSTANEAIGFAVGNGCQFNLGASITASITGSGVSAILNVTGLTSGGLAHGQTLTGAGVPAGVTINACTAGAQVCVGNPSPSGFIPTTTTAQTWSLSGCGSCTAVSSESMTTAFASMGAGTGGAVTAPTIQPTDGAWGIALTNNASILYGDELYDNSGLVGNPLHSFFDNGMGGYFEPGLPVRPFGLFLGAAVSG